MARASMKRAASQSAGRGKRQRVSPMAKKCTVIAPAIKTAESLPQPVRSMISDRLVHVFGTYKEDRHAFQNTVSELVGKTLKATEGNLQAAIDEAHAKKAAQEGEGATLASANNDAQAASDAAAQAADGSKAHLAECSNGLKAARAGLNDLETAQRTGEADTSSTAAKKEKLEALIKEFFIPVKEGTLDKGLNKSAAYAGKHLGKEFAVLEKEFLACVVRTFSQAASAWGTFDHIVDKELEQSLKDITATLVSELAALAAAKETRVGQIEAAKAAVTAAEAQVTAAEEALAAATAAAKEAKAASKAAAAALKQQQNHIDKAGASLKDAEGSMAAFQSGPLAAYAEAEASTAPPPPPEPVAEPAVAAPLIEEAMQAAPPRSAQAQSTPTILSSPGVLLSRGLQGMAQAVGLAPSPRIASSPRIA